jgi:signal peptidase II
MKSGQFTFRKRPGMLPWLIIAITVAVVDQLTKLWIGKQLQIGQYIVLGPFFNLTLVYNKGAAFGFLASAGGWQRYFFTGFSIAAILFILYFLRKSAGQKLFCWSFSLILGGAIGNLTDRLLYGHVIDFIDFHIGAWHWPTFNIADSAITIGAILFVLDELRRVNRSSTK